MTLPKPDWLQARAEWIKKVHSVIKYPVLPDHLYKSLHLYYSDYPLGTWDSKIFVEKYLNMCPDLDFKSLKFQECLAAASALRGQPKAWLRQGMAAAGGGAGGAGGAGAAADVKSNLGRPDPRFVPGSREAGGREDFLRIYDPSKYWLVISASPTRGDASREKFDTYDGFLDYFLQFFQDDDDPNVAYKVIPNASGDKPWLRFQDNKGGKFAIVSNKLFPRTRQFKKFVNDLENANYHEFVEAFT